jgi:hypothetical protein
MRRSLHRLVAKAPWNDEALLGQVRNQVMCAREKDGPWWPESSTNSFAETARKIGCAPRLSQRSTDYQPVLGEAVGQLTLREGAERKLQSLSGFFSTT